MSKWTQCSLGDVIRLKRGYDLPNSERFDGEYPIVSSSGISGYHKYAKVKAPGVVTGRYGTIGEVFYIAQDFWPLNTSLYVEDFKGNEPRFVCDFLRLLDLGSQNVAGAVPGVNRNALHMMKVRVPDFSTQRKIAAILTAYDEMIENNRRRIALLEKMAEEIYREWFVRMRFPGHESAVFEKGVPVGWEVLSLGDMYKTTSGGTPSRTHLEYYEGEIPWVKTGELQNTFIFDTEEKISDRALQNSSAKVFLPGTILLAMYGATIGQLGILSIEAATNQACCAFIPKFPHLKYVYTFHLLKLIKNSLIQFSFGGAQQNISQELIKNFKVVVPKADLIELFSNATLCIYDELRVIAKIQSSLKKTRDILLPRLISGKLSVDALDIQFPASMLDVEAPSV